MCEEKSEQGQRDEMRAEPGASNMHRGSQKRFLLHCPGNWQDLCAGPTRPYSGWLWSWNGRCWADMADDDEMVPNCQITGPGPDTSRLWVRTTVMNAVLHTVRRINPSMWSSTLDEYLLGAGNFSFCRTISGLTKVLVRLAMTWHTWSRILMEYVSSSRRHRT